nr:uncharacterized protein LOC123278789 [Equus asinus]
MPGGRIPASTSLFPTRVTPAPRLTHRLGSANLIVEMARQTLGKKRVPRVTQASVPAPPALFLTAAQGLECKDTPSFHAADPRPQAPQTTPRPRARGLAPAGRGLPTGLAGDWLKPARWQRKEPIWAAAAGGGQAPTAVGCGWASRLLLPPTGLFLGDLGDLRPWRAGAPSVTLPLPLVDERAGRRPASEKAQQAPGPLRAQPREKNPTWGVVRFSVDTSQHPARPVVTSVSQMSPKEVNHLPKVTRPGSGGPRLEPWSARLHAFVLRVVHKQKSSVADYSWNGTG